MPIERTNPISIEVLGSLNTPDHQEVLDELVTRIEQIDQVNHEWLDKQRKLIKLRFGPRSKRKIPWEGASNINVPLTDSISRRFRPGIASLFLDANPVAFFTSPDTDDFEPARSAEPFFHWMTREQMQMDEDVLRLVTMYSDRGHAYAREGWNYKTALTSRVVRAEELFPDGIEAFLQQAAAQHDAQGVGGGFVPEDAIVRVLELEYGLSMNDDEEAAQLVAVAQGLMEGRPYMRITYRTAVKDQADWKALDPLNVIVDQDSENVEDAELFVVIHEMTPEQVMSRAVDGIFDRDAAMAVRAAVLESGDDANQYTDTPGDTLRQQIKDLMDRRSGRQTRSGEQTGQLRTKIWEIFTKLDLDGDGVAERYRIWYAPHAKVSLAWTDYVMPFDQWPITLFKFEPQAARPIDSRGIPELLFELQKLVNAQHNMRLDAGTITLSPAMQIKNSSQLFEKLIKWRPGAIYPVSQIGDVSPVIHDLRILSELLREEQVTQRLAESYIGTFDATINQLQQSSERRTAAEIQAITQLASNVFGLDARMFQVSMGRSLGKLWDLYVEFGPPRLYFRVSGEERPRLAIKREIARRFDIKPAGTPANTNRALMLANTERVMGLVLQDQSGLFAKDELMKHWLQLLDFNLSKKIVRTPEQSAAAQVVNQAAQGIAEEQGFPPPSSI